MCAKLRAVEKWNTNSLVVHQHQPPCTRKVHLQHQKRHRASHRLPSVYLLLTTLQIPEMDLRHLYQPFIVFCTMFNVHVMKEGWLIANVCWDFLIIFFRLILISASFRAVLALQRVIGEDRAGSGCGPVLWSKIYQVDLYCGTRSKIYQTIPSQNIALWTPQCGAQLNSTI